MTNTPTNTESPAKVETIRQKHQARVMAIQALYASMISEEKIEKTLQDVINSNQTYKDIKYDNGFLNEICTGAAENHLKLQNFIVNNLSENWTYERMNNLTKAILIVGLYEAFNAPIWGVNKSIVIDEYIKITRSFNLEKDIGFINSVMDKMKERESLSDTL